MAKGPTPPLPESGPFHALTGARRAGSCRSRSEAGRARARARAVPCAVRSARSHGRGAPSRLGGSSSVAGTTYATTCWPHSAMRTSRDRHVGDLRMLLERALDLVGPDGLGARTDRLVEPAADVEPPLVVDRPGVGRQEPPGGGERRAGRRGIVPVALHDRRTTQLDPIVVADPQLGPLERNAVVDDAAAALGEPVRRDDPCAVRLRGGAQLPGHGSAAQQEDAEPRQVRVRIDQPAEHRGHERDARTGRGSDRLRQPIRIEALEHGDRPAEKRGTQEHQEPADVGRRETGDPRVVVGGLEGAPRSLHGGRDGVPRELRELGGAAGPRGSHDDTDARRDRRRLREHRQLAVGLEQRGGTGAVDQRRPLGRREPMVQRQERDPARPQAGDERAPRRSGLERDRDQLTRCQVVEHPFHARIHIGRLSLGGGFSP